jgi:hypothetical protein
MMNFLFSSFRIGKWRIQVPAFIWFVLAFAAVLAETLRGSINNYQVYKHVFLHVLDQTNLYASYPAEYQDVNNYGPVFSWVIAPFALLPDWLGVILWALTNAWILFYAISRLPVDRQSVKIMLLITTLEMMTSIHNVQFNPMVAAWLILAFVLVEKEKDFWGTLFIAAGFLVKIYGIVGLLFFLFSKHRVKFSLSFIFWIAVLFCLPMFLSSPGFIVQTYHDWMEALIVKNNKNIGDLSASNMQDICVMGMIRRIFHPQGFADWMVLLPAAALLLLPLLRFRQYQRLEFRLRYLALLLITVVVFSTSAESATYAIALPGVAIWYILNYRRPAATWIHVVLVFVLVVTSLSPTDLFPAYIKTHFIRPYSLKALPCFVVWLLLVAEVMFRSYVPARKDR